MWPCISMHPQGSLRAAPPKRCLLARHSKPMPCSFSAVLMRLTRPCAVQDLAINGCCGVTDAIWSCLSMPMQPGGSPTQALPARKPQQPHALQSLSCVGCKNLRSCFLGMLPHPDSCLQSQVYHQVQDWVPATCSLAGQHCCTKCVYFAHPYAMPAAARDQGYIMQLILNWVINSLPLLQCFA